MGSQPNNLSPSLNKFLTRLCLSIGPLQYGASLAIRSYRMVHVQPASMKTHGTSNPKLISPFPLACRFCHHLLPLLGCHCRCRRLYPLDVTSGGGVRQATVKTRPGRRGDVRRGAVAGRAEPARPGRSPAVVAVLHHSAQARRCQGRDRCRHGLAPTFSLIY